MRDVPSPGDIEAAEAYDALFVPALFQPWAGLVLDAAQVCPGQRVLDVACGTGVLAREALTRVGPTGSVAGIDLSPGMLAVAQRQAPSVDWRQGTAAALPYPDASFDAVVSQFGLMFFEDRRTALREMLRVAVSQGRLVVAVWDSLEHNPAYASEVALLDRLAGVHAGDALRIPFVLGDRQDLLACCEDAGFTPVTFETRAMTARFPTIRTMVEADLRGWLPMVGVMLTEEQIKHILKEAERDLSRYVTGEGHVAFEMSAHIVNGLKP